MAAPRHQQSRRTGRQGRIFSRAAFPLESFFHGKKKILEISRKKKKKIDSSVRTYLQHRTSVNNSSLLDVISDLVLLDTSVCSFKSNNINITKKLTKRRIPLSQVIFSNINGGSDSLLL